MAKIMTKRQLEKVVTDIKPPGKEKEALPMKDLKSTIFKRPKRDIILQIKVNHEEDAQITALANAHANGNKSAWMRGSSLYFHPKMLTKKTPVLMEEAVD